MKRCALLLGLLSALSVPASAHALGFVVFGNEPFAPGSYGPEILKAVNTDERVYAYIHDWQVSFYFKGGPKALNEAMRRFADIPADKREIILRPGPAKPENSDKPINYDWCLRIPGNRIGRGAGVAIVESEIADTRATLTVYIPEPLPPALVDPKKARLWIADLGSDDFKTRERAAKELGDLGTSVAAILREALKDRPTPEARDRTEKLLAAMSKDIRLDVLELPDGVPVASLDTLMARGRKEIANKAAHLRADGAWYLVSTGAPAEEIVPDLEKLLKTETYEGALAKVAQAAWQLGAGGKPLLPRLREIAKSEDKSLANICQQAIANIEKAKAEPVPDAEAKRRATIRKEIREFVDGRRDK